MRSSCNCRSAEFALIVALCLVVLAGCGGQKEPWPPDQTSTQRSPEVVVVTADPVTVRSVERTVDAVGTLHGYEEVTISAKVDGAVTKIYRDIADRVKPGDPLLEIDPTDYKLAVNQAEKALQVELAKLGVAELPAADFDVTQLPTVVQARVKLENAQARFERTKAVASATTPGELQDRLTDFRVAEAELESQILIAKTSLATIALKQEDLAIARQRLKDTSIFVPTPTMPVPGVEKNGIEYAITQRPVAEGSLVGNGSKLFQLVIEHPLKLRAPLPERHAGEIALGQYASVVAAAYREPFIGTVTRINPTVDPANRTFEVEILIPNTERKLKPGSFAKVAIRTRLDEDAVTVPLESPVHFAGVTKLFMIENGQAKEVQVTLGQQGQQWVEVTSPPLTPGTKVVTSGQTVLANGTPVMERDVLK